MHTATLLTLGLYFLVMLGIGLYGYRRSTQDVAGYMLAGRSLSPSVTALSAGASDMSGWILMGLPGAMLLSGISASWIAIGLLIGAYFNYLLVAPRLRLYTEIANDALTIPDYFAQRFMDQGNLLRIISALVIIVFFTLYTASGMVAGGKLFDSAFNLPYTTGLYITTAVVVSYTLFGGFLAVSMTDFVQGCIMFVALILVPVVAIWDMQPHSVLEVIQAQDPSLLALFGGTTFVGIISSMAWGLGYFGQPHIIVRFMAIRSVKDVATARRIGMTWMLVSVVGAMAVGLTGIAYAELNDINLQDAETIFILYSKILFHPLITGFLLAAILAAIMSTISSQLLVTSSSLTNDLYQTLFNKNASQQHLVAMGRLAVLAVALLAISIAHNQNSSILSLVSNAWAGFGAAFGPVILFSLFWANITKAGAIAGMLVGTLTVLAWIYLPVTIGGQSLSQWLYEIVPGFIASSVVIYGVSKQWPDNNSALQQRHQQLEMQLTSVK